MTSPDHEYDDLIDGNGNIVARVRRDGHTPYQWGGTNTLPPTSLGEMNAPDTKVDPEKTVWITRLNGMSYYTKLCSSCGMEVKRDHKHGCYVTPEEAYRLKSRGSDDAWFRNKTVIVARKRTGQ